MESLIALSDKCASAEEETNIDETKFVEFMRECPIWTYFKYRILLMFRNLTTKKRR